MHAWYRECMRIPPVPPSFRCRQAIALCFLLLAFTAAPACAEEASGAGTAWAPQDPLRICFDAGIGYFLPLGYDPGFELAGPSWRIAISFVPFILQTPVIQLAARAEADLAEYVRLEPDGEGLLKSLQDGRRHFPDRHRAPGFRLDCGHALAEAAVPLVLDFDERRVHDVCHERHVEIH